MMERFLAAAAPGTREGIAAGKLKVRSWCKSEPPTSSQVWAALARPASKPGLQKCIAIVCLDCVWSPFGFVAGPCTGRLGNLDCAAALIEINPALCVRFRGESKNR